MVLDQHLPGKARRLIRIDLVERVGRKRQRPNHIVQREFSGLYAEEPELQRANHTAQARIGRQHLHKPLGLRKHRHLWLKLLGAHEQETVLRKEGATLRRLDGAEKILLRRKSRHQRGGRFLDQLRGRRVDDRDNNVELGEGFFKRLFPLAPRTVAGNQLIDIRGHGKMRGGIPGRQDRNNDRPGDDPPGVMNTKSDRADDESSDRFHGM